MEKHSNASNVLDLLLFAATTSPEVIYCKSSNHEFTYEQFVFASIKLSNQIAQRNLKDKSIAILLPNSILFLSFIYFENNWPTWSSI